MPLALTFGAAAYMTASTEPDWPLLLGVAAPPALIWLVLRRRPGGLIALVFGLAACAGLGGIAGKVRTFLQAAPVLMQEIGPVRIEGIVAEIDASERSRRIRIAPRAIEGLTPEMTPMFVRFSYREDIDFGPGWAVACTAILSPPPRPVVPGDYAFHRDAFFQQLGAVGFATGKCEPLPNTPPSTFEEKVSYWIGAIRRMLAEHVNEAAGARGGGMSAAMIAGDRSFIAPEDSEALRLSGLAHLLSISGVHMVLAGGIIFFLIRVTWPLIEPLALRVPSVKAAAFGAVAGCTLYFIVSGMEVATQRAYVMAIIGFGAKLFDRPALSLRSVAVALFAVVLLQPESVVTPGFQMSFAASAALIALYEVWPRLDKPDRPGFLARIGPWVVGTVATSLVASIATMPFALYHFNRAALFSVLANIVSTPVITLWTTPAAAAAALAAPFGLEEPFLALTGKSIEVVLDIARWSVKASPQVDLPRMTAGGMAWAAAAIGVFCLASGRGRVLTVVPLAASIVLWIGEPQAAGYVATDGSVFLKAQRGWIELVNWRADNGLNPLIIGDDISKAPCAKTAEACEMDLPSGHFSISGTAELPPEDCPSAAVLTFVPKDGASLLRIKPCAYVGRGGAVLKAGWRQAAIHAAPLEGLRAWSQPLWERPKRKTGPGSRH